MVALRCMMFELLTALTISVLVFWVVKLSGLVRLRKHHGMHYLHLQGSGTPNYLNMTLSLTARLS